MTIFNTNIYSRMGYGGENDIKLSIIDYVDFINAL